MSSAPSSPSSPTPNGALFHGELTVGRGADVAERFVVLLPKCLEFYDGERSCKVGAQPVQSIPLKRIDRIETTSKGFAIILQGGKRVHVQAKDDDILERWLLAVNKAHAKSLTGNKKAPNIQRPSQVQVRRGRQDPQLRQPSVDGHLKVDIIGATGLKRMDLGVHTKCDPYCACWLYQKPETRIHTTVIECCTVPKWNFQLYMSEFEPGDDLVFEVWDSDQGGSLKSPRKDDFMGSVRLECDNFYPNGFDGELQLEPQGSGRLRVRASFVGGNRIDHGEEHRLMLGAQMQGCLFMLGGRCWERQYVLVFHDYFEHFDVSANGEFSGRGAARGHVRAADIEGCSLTTERFDFELRDRRLQFRVEDPQQLDDWGRAFRTLFADPEPEPAIKIARPRERPLLFKSQTVPYPKRSTGHLWSHVREGDELVARSDLGRQSSGSTSPRPPPGGRPPQELEQGPLRQSQRQSPRQAPLPIEWSPPQQPRQPLSRQRSRQAALPIERSLPRQSARVSPPQLQKQATRQLRQTDRPLQARLSCESSGSSDSERQSSGRTSPRPPPGGRPPQELQQGPLRQSQRQSPRQAPLPIEWSPPQQPQQSLSRQRSRQAALPIERSPPRQSERTSPPQLQRQATRQLRQTDRPLQSRLSRESSGSSPRLRGPRPTHSGTWSAGSRPVLTSAGSAYDSDNDGCYSRLALHEASSQSSIGQNLLSGSCLDLQAGMSSAGNSAMHSARSVSPRGIVRGLGGLLSVGQSEHSTYSTHSHSPRGVGASGIAVRAAAKARERVKYGSPAPAEIDPVLRRRLMARQYISAPRHGRA